MASRLAVLAVAVTLGLLLAAPSAAAGSDENVEDFPEEESAEEPPPPPPDAPPPPEKVDFSGSKVELLKAATFEATIGGGDDVWLVEWFYPTRCPKCIEVADILIEAAAKLPAGVRIGAVDLSIDAALGKRFGINREAPVLLTFGAEEKVSLRKSITLAPRWAMGKVNSGDITTEAVAEWAAGMAEENVVAARRAQLAAPAPGAAKLRALADKLSSPAGLGTAAAVLAVYLALTLGLSGKEAAGKAAAERKRQAALDERSKFEAIEREERAAAVAQTLQAAAEEKEARRAEKKHRVAEAKARAAAKALLETPEARRAAVAAAGQKRRDAAVAAKQSAGLSGLAGGSGSGRRLKFDVQCTNTMAKETVEAASGETVGGLKARILAAGLFGGPAVSAQRVVYAGEVLGDTVVLGDLGLSAGKDTLMLAVA